MLRPSPQGIIIKPKQTKVHLPVLRTQKTMNCSCGQVVHVSKIQLYLYDNISQKERVFDLDRSQRLSQINSAHLHWNLKNKQEHNFLLLSLRVKQIRVLSMLFATLSICQMQAELLKEIQCRQFCHCEVLIRIKLIKVFIVF